VLKRLERPLWAAYAVGMKTARYWDSVEGGKVRCMLCPHGCLLGDAQTGLCHVRTARGGELLAAGYGLISSAQVDPIEKKPLHHFFPGEDIYSIGGWGCNFACVFCQNWTISQQVIEGNHAYSPDEIVAKALKSGSLGIAYTYNEPLVAFEFVYDCAVLARENGLANVLVTNGYINAEPAAELLPLINALNIDVKSMDEDFYSKKCRGHVAPVLALAEQAVEAGCHVEITNLLIPGLNDDDALIGKLAEWIANSLGPQTPLHLSAYRPQFKLTLPATRGATLERARGIALQYLPYVYLGNVYAEEGQNTDCPWCGARLVTRRGYDTQIVGIENGCCTKCGKDSDVVTRTSRSQ
jgi:pyruvate formate lyase activating enzyme